MQEYKNCKWDDHINVQIFILSKLFVLNEVLDECIFIYLVPIFFIFVKKSRPQQQICQ